MIVDGRKPLKGRDKRILLMDPIFPYMALGLKIDMHVKAIARINVIETFPSLVTDIT